MHSGCNDPFLSLWDFLPETIASRSNGELVEQTMCYVARDIFNRTSQNQVCLQGGSGLTRKWKIIDHSYQLRSKYMIFKAFGWQGGRGSEVSCQLTTIARHQLLMPGNLFSKPHSLPPFPPSLSFFPGYIPAGISRACCVM